MKTLYYHTSSYISHRTAGQAYRRAMLQAGIPLADRPEDADVVILHDAPVEFPAILKAFPVIRKKELIAYSVWETDILPDAYAEPLSMVDTIWTCSEFSRAALQTRFENVSVVPHIVEETSLLPDDVSKVKKMITYDPDAYYFYTIMDSLNPRKNLAALLDIFMKNFLHDPDVFLVVKQYRTPVDLSGLKKVIPVNASLTDSQISALHHLCHCYVSAHHCEAWGLPLSDALGTGNAVIATGYSGNMAFMNRDNSYPADFTLSRVSKDMCRRIPLFTTAMHWADPDPGHFGHLMRKVRGMGPPRPGERRLIAESMRPFRPAAVADILRERLR